MVESAQLLISELVVNSVLHAESEVTVRLDLLPGKLRVGIADGSPVAPEVRTVDAASVTGRGLMIVEALASDWGVEPTADGKVVWFELDADEVDAAQPSDG